MIVVLKKSWVNFFQSTDKKHGGLFLVSCLLKQSSLRFNSVTCTATFYRSDNILSAVSVWHSHQTISYWHEPWPHNSHKTSGFLFLLTLFEPSIETKVTVDTAMHNWSFLSYNTTNQTVKCLRMIRQGEGVGGGGVMTWPGRRQVNGSVKSWWKYIVRLWKIAPLGDSSKSWTKPEKCTSLSVCLPLLLSMCVCVCGKEWTKDFLCCTLK